MSKPQEFLDPSQPGDRDEKGSAAKPLAARVAVTASLLLASSVTLGSVDASITSASTQETGPSISALSRAMALLEDEGVADAAREAEDLIEIAQWGNFSNFQNY